VPRRNTAPARTGAAGAVPREIARDAAQQVHVAAYVSEKNLRSGRIRVHLGSAKREHFSSNREVSRAAGKLSVPRPSIPDGVGCGAARLALQGLIARTAASMIAFINSMIAGAAETPEPSGTSST
jgi:hypothetical protein